MSLKTILRSVARSFGVDVIRYRQEPTFPPDVPETLLATFRTVKPYTMTSPERIFSLCEAVRYISEKHIPGDIVECGVWKGGSMMAIAETLTRLGDTARNLYLFDTYEGMTPPTQYDVDIEGASAHGLLRISNKDSAESVWCRATLDVVKNAIGLTKYPGDRIHYVVGMVENTIPEAAPQNIALLRLDTDWYESTKHELEHLFPRLTRGGVLIIDDYGHWQGAKKAVDEYLSKNRVRILLNRIDYAGRIAVKVD